SEVEDFNLSPYKGNIFETFIYSELLKHSKYSNCPYTIYYYKTLDRKEIDFIVSRGDEIIALEVKLSSSVHKEDFKNIIALSKEFSRLKCGYVLYMGDKIIPFGKNLYALPATIFF
ncbi:MAG: DUF4143 domain-containing protein, partial [Acidobacteria bacterium]|nr:DUF4143 domain-containing protein [Acidobacteriota bacterium]